MLANPPEARSAPLSFCLIVCESGARLRVRFGRLTQARKRNALTGPSGARSPGTRFAFAFIRILDIERRCGADEVRQCRLIDLVTFADVDGAPDIPVEAGVEQTGRVL